MAFKITDSGFKDWHPNKLNDLDGKTFFITGGNSGIGLEAAIILASKGANILISSRSVKKAEIAIGKIKKNSRAKVDYVILDLSSKDSIDNCTSVVKEKYNKLDAIINNAGIMQTPQTKTVDGHELQFATNHLGHFYLNSQLFNLVENAAGRIVVVSSIAHKLGGINFDDIMHEHNYDSTKVYAQSKLANLMYGLELDRRLKNTGSPVACVICHPGYSNTNLQSSGPRLGWKFLYKFTNILISQPAFNGAIPTVLAAAGEEAVAGAYYGPQLMAESRGRVSDANVAKQALDEKSAELLWKRSEELLDYTWDIH
ncbi:MAG: short-chain dehydrogenase [Bacteriovorax sp. MedPE-SWde]|mgnify:CR=1 FL=1|nr:MAG: short-chain dehydrogenase [Bacteriovorax sp. MedPE-SWde]